MTIRFCSPFNSHVGYDDRGRVIGGPVLQSDADVSVLPIAIGQTRPMTEAIPFYDARLSWAEPHLDDAVDKLRDLHANCGDWSRDAQMQRSGLLERYSPAARQAMLKRALGIGA
jgi:hypothetical protein